MVKIICKECLNIYIWGENPEPVILSCDEVFNTDFTTTTDATLTSAWWSSVGANFWLTSNWWQWLHFVDYTTDKPAGIEFPISNIKWKTIKFSIEWQIWTHTRWGGWDFRISTINNSGTWVKDQYTTWFNLCSFPFYATTSGGGQYSWMWTWWWWYTDTVGSSSTSINWDQDGTVYMWTYGNTHLWLTIWTWIWKAEWEYDLKNMVYTCSFSTIINWETSTATFTRTFNNATSAEKAKMEEILDWDYGNLYVILNNWRWYWYQSYDTNYITKAKVEVCEPTTIVCDFKADWTWTTTVNDLLVEWDFCRQRSWNTAMSAGDNWTLRLSIPATDYSAAILLWGGNSNWTITNLWYSNWWVDWLKQNLIKKAYLKMSTLYDSWQWDSWNGAYPVFNRWWIHVRFSKKVIQSNWSPRDWTSTSCCAWFTFPRWDNSSRSSYIVHPIDANTQYLALPTTENLWENHTATWYIDQWVSCLYSRLTLETRGSSPSNFHYRLIVWATWNEYDLWLCSNLWSCALQKSSWDRWKVWSYIELDEAYLEFFDNYYIDETWNITTTKPR